MRRTKRRTSERARAIFKEWMVFDGSFLSKSQKKKKKLLLLLVVLLPSVTLALTLALKNKYETKRKGNTRKWFYNFKLNGHPNVSKSRRHVGIHDISTWDTCDLAISWMLQMIG